MNISILAISWFLSFGFVPSQTDVVGDSFVTIPAQEMPATVAEIGLSVKILDRLTIYGSIENYQLTNDFTSFLPYRADYKAGASLEIIKGLTINATHECDHPVIFSYGPGKEDYEYTYMSSETQFFIKIQGGDK